MSSISTRFASPAAADPQLLKGPLGAVMVESVVRAAPRALLFAPLLVFVGLVRAPAGGGLTALLAWLPASLLLAIPVSFVEVVARERPRAQRALLACGVTAVAVVAVAASVNYSLELLSTGDARAATGVAFGVVSGLSLLDVQVLGLGLGVALQLDLRGRGAGGLVQLAAVPLAAASATLLLELLVGWPAWLAGRLSVLSGVATLVWVLAWLGGDRILALARHYRRLKGPKKIGG